MDAEDEIFLEQIIEERDRLFREASKLKSQLAGYENFESERTSYQQQIAQKDQRIDQLNQTVQKLQQQVEMLLRKVWGKSSERFVNEDPQQRRLDFEGLDLLPEEEELATSAKQEIEQYKTISVPVKAKDHHVRKPLP